MLVVAPTANAAFLIGGKTVDSALGFFPMENNRYSQAQPGKMSMMKFQYDDVKVIFCDEISMVGSMKLAKINYRLQDLAEGGDRRDFMGGISFVASGNFIHASFRTYYSLIFQVISGSYLPSTILWCLTEITLMVDQHVHQVIGMKISEFST